jgi:hypothetical protein
MFSPLRKVLPMLLLPLAAQAEEIFIVNPGFEEQSGNVFNEFSFGPLPGWDLYDSGNPIPFTNGGAGPNYFIGTLSPTEVENHSGIQYFPAGAPEGNRVGIAFNMAGTGGGGEYGFLQVLSATLQANTSYTLQVLVGNIASGYSVNGDQYILEGFPGYRIDLMAGDQILASDTNSLAGSIPEGTFAQSTLTFTTDANPDFLGANLAIRLVNLNVVDPAYPSAHLEVDFDNVRLTAEAVPEPASTALLLGALLLVAARRRS